MKKELIICAVSLVAGALIFWGYLIFQDFRFKVNAMWPIVAPVIAQQQRQQRPIATPTTKPPETEKAK